jgi:hypothetical protein
MLCCTIADSTAGAAEQQPLLCTKQQLCTHEQSAVKQQLCTHEQSAASQLAKASDPPVVLQWLSGTSGMSVRWGHACLWDLLLEGVLVSAAPFVVVVWWLKNGVSNGDEGPDW